MRKELCFLWRTINSERARLTPVYQAVVATPPVLAFLLSQASRIGLNADVPVSLPVWIVVVWGVFIVLLALTKRGVALEGVLQSKVTIDLVETDASGPHSTRLNIDLRLENCGSADFENVSVYVSSIDRDATRLNVGEITLKTSRNNDVADAGSFRLRWGQQRAVPFCSWYASAAHSEFSFFFLNLGEDLRRSLSAVRDCTFELRLIGAGVPRVLELRLKVDDQGILKVTKEEKDLPPQLGGKEATYAKRRATSRGGG